MMVFWYHKHHLDMKAVILAAGEGKRLHPLTLTRPKPLVHLLDKPLIEHIWEALPETVDEVVLVVGYKGDMLREFLGKKFQGRRVTYVEQEKAGGTAYAINLCRKHLVGEEKFLVMYADDLHGTLGIAKCLEHDAALLVAQVEDPRRFGVVVRNANGTVERIDEKPENPESNLAATGVYVLTPKIFDYYEERPRAGEYYLTEMIEGFIQDYSMHVVESDFWLPIAYPEDIARAERLIRK